MPRPREDFRLVPPPLPPAPPRAPRLVLAKPSLCCVSPARMALCRSRESRSRSTSSPSPPDPQTTPDSIARVCWRRAGPRTVECRPYSVRRRVPRGGLPQDPEVLYPTALIVGLADDVTINATPVTACAAYADKIDLERAAILACAEREPQESRGVLAAQGGLDCVPAALPGSPHHALLAGLCMRLVCQCV